MTHKDSPEPSPPQGDAHVFHDVKDSKIVNNPGTIQAGNFIIGDVHNAPKKDGDAPSAQLYMVNNLRGVRLEVTNNDIAEELTVETVVAPYKVRPRWSDGQPTKKLKRGETGSMMLMYLEPDRPSIALRMWIGAEYALEYWKQRIDRGTRIIRLYGPDKNSDVSPEFYVDSVYKFEFAVFSDDHPPERRGFDFAVSQNDCLVMPYSKEELDRINALGLTEQTALLAYLDRRLAERAERKAGR